MSTLPSQHLLHQRLGDRLRMQQRVKPRILGRQPTNQRRLRKALRDEHRAHTRRIVPRYQLGAQALVEGNRGGLGRGVIDHVGGSRVARLRGNGDDHAVVAADHVREELARQPVVGEGVDLELEASVGLAAAEDGAAAADAGVVDQDGGLAHGGADGGGGIGDGCRRGDVAFVEADCCGQEGGVLRRLDVQDGHFDAAVAEQARDLPPDAVAAAGEDDHFTVPVVAVGDAVVEGAAVESRVDAPEDGERGEDVCELEQAGALLRELFALVGIVR